VTTNALITISNVDLSPDLRLAKIYISIFDQNKSNINTIFSSLKIQKKSIRFKIGRELNSKYVPDIKFVLDDEYENYDKISKIIKNG